MKKPKNLVCGALSFTFGGLAIGCIVGSATTVKGDGTALIVLTLLMAFGCYIFSEGIVR